MLTADHRQAFADESFREAPSGGGLYVLAAAVFDGTDHDLNRQAMLRLRDRQNAGSKVKKLHWTTMDTQRRRDAVKQVAELTGFHVVAIGAPVPHRRQERARAMCLAKLVLELHSYDVHTLYLEARPNALNHRDLQTVSGARHLLPMGSRFSVEHRPGSAEPLFWMADIVAGAVRAHREGEADYQPILEECLLRDRRRHRVLTCVRPGSRYTPGAPDLATRTPPTVMHCHQTTRPSAAPATTMTRTGDEPPAIFHGQA